MYFCTSFNFISSCFSSHSSAAFHHHHPGWLYSESAAPPAILRFAMPFPRPQKAVLVAPQFPLFRISLSYLRQPNGEQTKTKSRYSFASETCNSILNIHCLSIESQWQGKDVLRLRLCRAWQHVSNSQLMIVSCLCVHLTTCAWGCAGREAPRIDNPEFRNNTHL